MVLSVFSIEVLLESAIFLSSNHVDFLTDNRGLNHVLAIEGNSYLGLNFPFHFLKLSLSHRRDI